MVELTFHFHDQLITVLVHLQNHLEINLFGILLVRTQACAPYEHPLEAF